MVASALHDPYVSWSHRKSYIETQSLSSKPFFFNYYFPPKVAPYTLSKIDSKSFFPQWINTSVFSTSVQLCLSETSSPEQLQPKSCPQLPHFPPCRNAAKPPQSPQSPSRDTNIQPQCSSTQSRVNYHIFYKGKSWPANLELCRVVSWCVNERDFQNNWIFKEPLTKSHAKDY